jgi:formamidopyrimidine-DNA glycosylase
MPELPEVETVTRGLKKHLLNNEIVEFTLFRNKLRNYIPKEINQLKNEKIHKIYRRAKYIIIETGSSYLIIHLGMTGKFLIKDYLYEPGKHDHYIIKLANNLQAIYNDVRRFGVLEYLAKENNLDQQPLLAKLGCEPLSTDFTLELLSNLCQKSKKNIKSFLLDPQHIVGIGNIYAAEALFQAKISPTRAASSLTKKELKLLYKAIPEILNKAIDAGGSTLKDFSDSNGASGYFQHNFQVYGREKENCFTCNNKILRIVQQQRSTFYCPTCQST